VDHLQFQGTGAVRAPSSETLPRIAPPDRVPASSRRPVLAIAGLLFACAVALVLTQFTGGARGDHASEVRQVVRTYETAIMTGDGNTACRQLTPGAMQQLLQMSAGAGQGGTCAQVAQSMKRYVDTLVAQAPSPQKAAEARHLIQDPPVRVVAMSGAHATAQIAGQSDKPIRLVDGDGGWKISGFPFPAP
jgi:hypothetical protein